IAMLGFGAISIGHSNQPTNPPSTAAKEPSGPDSKRDRFNDPLPPNAIARMGTVAFRHPGVRGLGYSQDGKLLVTWGGQCFSIWNFETGEELKRYGGRQHAGNDEVNAAALSGDGSRLTFHSWRKLLPQGIDGRVSIWNVREAKEERSFSVDCREPGVPFGGP